MNLDGPADAPHSISRRAETSVVCECFVDGSEVESEKKAASEEFYAISNSVASIRTAAAWLMKSRRSRTMVTPARSCT